MTIRTVISALVLTATLAASAVVQPAAASRQLAVSGQSEAWDEISNYKGWPVSKLVVAGVDKGPSKQIREGLRLANDGVLYRQQLQEDIARVRLFLAQRGYPFSRVKPLIEPDRAARELELTLEIDRGPAVIARSYQVVNVPIEHLARFESSLRIRAGDVFTDDGLETDLETVVDQLKTEGHARADAAAEFVWIDSTTVAVRIVAVPGPVCYFREVTVEGVTEDLSSLAHTLVDIRRGERYKLRTEREARDYLSRTGLFRQIRITLEDAAFDSLDVVIDLQERKPRSIETAVGYWSDERFTGRIRWQHRNIFRRGRGMSVELVYNQFRQWGELATWWPALFGMKKSLGTFRLGINSENEDSYEMIAPTTGVSFGYNFTRRFAGTLSASISRPSYDIKTDERVLFPDEEGLVGWLEGRLTRDGTNDRIAPTSGSFTWLRFQWGPQGGVSEANWILIEGNGSYLFRIKSTVLAINGRLGWGKPIEPAVVLLPDRRFYAGGPMDHRGFYRRELGPKDSGGLPLGGEVLALGFVEYRFPIAWKFNGAVFVDWGQVWQTNGDVTLDNIEVAVGPAIRIMTPVGPLRFDWGIRVTNYDTSQPKSAFHFAIGYPM
jgi:outer membrane protein insertion porin family